MGIFHTTISVAALGTPDRRRELQGVMVATGSEYNWVPRDVLEELGVARVRIDRFETADGRVLEREVGFALIYAGGRSAAAAVVFAGDGGMVLLGAHGLEGLNLCVDLAEGAGSGGACSCCGRGNGGTVERWNALTQPASRYPRPPAARC